MAQNKSDDPLAKRLDRIVDQLDQITTRLDLLVNLSLDAMPDENFGKQREFTSKLERLDSMRRFKLQPSDAGRIFGRGSNDISSRRKEIKGRRKKKAKA